MATGSNFGEFDSSKEDWRSYNERLAQYFTATDIVDASKKWAILLSSCDPPVMNMDYMQRKV